MCLNVAFVIKRVIISPNLDIFDEVETNIQSESYPTAFKYPHHTPGNMK